MDTVRSSTSPGRSVSGGARRTPCKGIAATAGVLVLKDASRAQAAGVEVVYDEFSDFDHFDWTWIDAGPWAPLFWNAPSNPMHEAYAYRYFVDSSQEVS